MAAYHPPTCLYHPKAHAGWRCERCRASLCPACVRVRRVQEVELFSCAACKEPVELLRRHRAWLPLAARLREVWRYPFTRGGLIVLLGLAALRTLLGWLMSATSGLAPAMVPGLLAAGLLWGQFFSLARDSARGVDEPQVPDFRDAYWDVLVPVAMSMAALLCCWLPALLYLGLADIESLAWGLELLMGLPRFQVLSSGKALSFVQGDPIFWLLALLGLAAMPGALSRAVRGSMRDLLNPVGLVRDALLLGRDYLLTVAAFATLGLVHLAIRAVSGAVLELGVPLLSRWLTESLDLLVPLTMARVLGLLLYVRGDLLGYGLKSDYHVPVLSPEEQATARPAEEAPPSLEPELGPQGPDPEAQVATLTAAVEARDVDRALELYASLRLTPSFIPPACHLFVGQAAASRGQYPLATRALEAAADAEPGGPLAPRALVLLARVLGERLQETARAQDLYRYILERYPDTDAARFAQDQLG